MPGNVHILGGGLAGLSCAADLSRQGIRVALDGETVLEAAIEPEQSYAFSVAVPAKNTDFHQLDVWASATVRVRDEVLSVQILTLAIVGDDGTEISLIP